MMTADLRSDTVTRPGPGMLQAMWAAPVGDDVFVEDPSIMALEAKAAALFGLEAGLFCPSGTMTNQIAIKGHTEPLSEVICDITAHVYQYEVGGIKHVPVVAHLFGTRKIRRHVGKHSYPGAEVNP